MGSRSGGIFVLKSLILQHINFVGEITAGKYYLHINNLIIFGIKNSGPFLLKGLILKTIYQCGSTPLV